MYLLSSNEIAKEFFIPGCMRLKLQITMTPPGEYNDDNMKITLFTIDNSIETAEIPQFCLLSIYLLQSKAKAGTSDGSEVGTAATTQEHDDIMRTLLAHEKTSATKQQHVAGPGLPPSEDESSTSESEDEASKAGFTLPTSNIMDCEYTDTIIQ